MYLTCRMMHIFTLPGDKIWLAFGDDTVIIFNILHLNMIMLRQ